MTAQIKFKQGDTFILTGSVKIDDVLQDITNWTIKSKVKLPCANFSDDLVVTKLDPEEGSYQLKKADTTKWPSGIPAKTLVCDIEYIMDSGQIISTDTFEILCETGIT